MCPRGQPDLTDGGQDNIAVVIEIRGCIPGGMPNLTDGGQDNSADRRGILRLGIPSRDGHFNAEVGLQSPNEVWGDESLPRTVEACNPSSLC